MKRILSLFLFLLLSMPVLADSYELGVQFYKNRNYSNALFLLEEAATDQDARAYRLLGYLYYKKGDFDNALKFLLLDSEILAEQLKSPKAITPDYSTYRYLANIYQYHLDKYVEALKWYDKIPAQGMLAEDKYNIGYMYIHGKNDFASNVILGLSWLKDAASDNYPPAMYLLGVTYETGAGIPKDEAEAKNWYIKATNTNDITTNQEAREKLTEMASIKISKEKVKKTYVAPPPVEPEAEPVVTKYINLKLLAGFMVLIFAVGAYAFKKIKQKADDEDLTISDAIESTFSRVRQKVSHKGKYKR